MVLQQVQGLARQGRFADAKVLLQKEMKRGGASAVMDNAMAVVLLQLGEFELSEYHAERAASAKQPDARAVSTYGNVLSMRGKYEKALAVFERSLAAQPTYVPAMLGCANALWLSKRLGDAEAMLRRAAAVGRHPAVEGTLAAVMVTAGRAEEAWEIARSAAEKFPDDTTASTSLANAANFVPGIAAGETIEAQRHYGRLLERRRPLAKRPTMRDRAGRKLRVGFVSQDLRRHSVAYFFEPLLQHLSRERFELWCYSASARVDEVTERLRGISDGFRSIAGVGDERAAEMIRSDRVDVLVDLAGHTRDHRLEVFHLRPAPVQVTYLGYPNITGLAAIDARIVDRFADPEDGNGGGGGERLVRIDEPFICYVPPASAPEVRPRDAGKAGVTFGSFNALAKVNDAVLASWGRILQQTPGSRLLLKGKAFADGEARGTVTRRLTACGVDATRVELRPETAGLEEHLGMYHDVDIALDTFPYNGTTTTCEAMWMGVPVVTFAGDRHAARVGVSLLNAAGCPELVGRDVADYERLSVELAGDAGRVAAYRRTLREKMRAGPLCDGPRLGRAFGGALEGIWDEVWKASGG